MKPKLSVSIVFILMQFTLIAQTNNQKVEFDRIFKNLPKKTGDNFTTVFKDKEGDVVIHLYKPDKVDLQTPHPQDEFYMITSGKGKYIINSDTLTVKKGDLVFAPKGVEHKFYNFSKDFSTWVIFYGENLESNTNIASGNKILINDFLETWERTKTYTVSIVKAMPEKLFNAKKGDDRSFAEEVLHIMDNLYFLSSNYISEIGPSYLQLQYTTKEELIARFELAFNDFRDAVNSINDNNLLKKVKFFNGEFYSKQQILYLVKDHTAHHRAKMILMLKDAGVKPPKYVGW